MLPGQHTICCAKPRSEICLPSSRRALHRRLAEWLEAGAVDDPGELRRLSRNIANSADCPPFSLRSGSREPPGEPCSGATGWAC